MKLSNIPEVKLGIIAVSRDCFIQEMSKRRCAAVVAECQKKGIEIFQAPTCVENETDAIKALKEIENAGVNALVVFLGNFGPEAPETIIAQNFAGPVMFAAAAEETQTDLIDGRGDAYCGMLNASYNLSLRNIPAYIPEYPVGIAHEIADMVAEFIPVARIVIGISSLKIFGFGPRPADFFACNAPIKPFYDLGIEVQENSELDLFESFNAHEGDMRINNIVAEMSAELGKGNNYLSALPRLAQYEITLMDWYEKNKGASSYAIFANKCWPAFQTSFKMVPCYVNSRLAAKGIPVACEVDLYGALSEYIITCATGLPATLLDINNTVPLDMYDSNKDKTSKYKTTDLFMGFHCGNTPSCCLKSGCSLKHQIIMKRLLEPDGEPNISRGTLDGIIKPGDITLFRIQGTADCALTSYIAHGEVLDIDPRSFGGIGVFAVPEMGRFYRHVLIAKNYPHHAGIGFAHSGRALFSAMKMIGVSDVSYNQPKSLPYPDENPF